MNTIFADMLGSEETMFHDLIVQEDWVFAAKMVAIQAHAGQVDKHGVAYIHHPEAVAEIAATLMGAHHDPSHVIAVAWLHDVVEDSDISLDDLHEFFPEYIVDDVALLTRCERLTYRSFIDRLAASRSQVAITVKMADLRHNTLPSRKLDNPGLEKRYALAKRTLQDAINDIVRHTVTFFDEVEMGEVS